MEQEQQSPDLLLAIDKWLDITVDRFHEALDTYNIGKLDGALWQSIAGELVTSGGNVDAVIIKFLFYGRFLDMNVGKGRPLGSNRKVKPWFSKTKYREVARLREILATNLSGLAIQEVELAIKEGLINEF